MNRFDWTVFVLVVDIYPWILANIIENRPVLSLYIMTIYISSLVGLRLVDSNVNDDSEIS